MCSVTCSSVFELAGVGVGCSLFNVTCCLFHSLLVNKFFYYFLYLLLSISYVRLIYFLIFAFLFVGWFIIIFVLHKINL